VQARALRVQNDFLTTGASLESRGPNPLRARGDGSAAGRIPSPRVGTPIGPCYGLRRPCVPSPRTGQFLESEGKQERSRSRRSNHVFGVPESGWPPPPLANMGGSCLKLLSGKGLESAFCEGIGLKSHPRRSLPIGAPARSVCTAAAVASLSARFSHSCGINVSVASLGRCARTCVRYHGLFSPGSRPTASSQTLSASPTGLRARWACGHMVLGTTKCLHETWNGRFSSASRSPWSLKRAKWPLIRAKWSPIRAKWPSGRIGLPMATSL